MCYLDTSNESRKSLIQIKYKMASSMIVHSGRRFEGREPDIVLNIRRALILIC